MHPHVTAGIIIIGNEILSGRTRDANLSWLGKCLAELGIELRMACVIPDDESVIIEMVNQHRKQFTWVFTTGGIGPTHDDITAASIARAFAVPLEKNPQAVAAMEAYYAPGMLNEARLKMAHIPKGAILIENPISAAPGFQLKNVFVLPGVPLILQAMFEGITDRLTGGPPILSISVATNLREGDFARPLEELQKQNMDISIGSYPWFKQGKVGVNLVMRATDRDRLEEVAVKLKALITGLGGKLLQESDQ